MRTPTRPFAALTAVATLALALASAPALAQNDPGKMLGGLLQGLMKGGQQGSNSPTKSINVTEIASLATQALQDVDEPKEIQIGRHLAAVLLGAKPLHPNANLQRYVNRLGRWISLQTPRPHLPWTFGVLDDEGYNAFAAPGGYIFVTKGLIDRMVDEADLASVLAHEMAHVVGKHHLKAMQKSAQSGLLTQALATQVGGGVSGALKEQLLQMGREVYSRGLDQSDEFEADRVGVVYATAAGYDPYGLLAVLQQLAVTTGDNPAFALTFSTHPATSARLDQLETAMGQRLDAYTGQARMPLAERLAKAGAR
ncbi:M48 family metallopeptidase [Curvibacter sp. APW13]|uniref:M48 family metallopeptidase n=1 Tax=Curvibacter sp. APW13 TaxID=3077236 RepID=UPI0028DF736E|nr:M48 family metallopeptidase [Curvibacter sp. APW13]MDT8992069.1 M48 family metallopeptidase [Curvibacter sp. APW13]